MTINSPLLKKSIKKRQLTSADALA